MCIHANVSVQFNHSVVSDSLWPHGLQHTRLPCQWLTPRPCSNSCSSSQWCHPTISSSVVPFCRWCHTTISSSVIPFSFCLQSFPASRSFPAGKFIALGGQSIVASASASVLPVNILDWLISWFDLLAVQRTLKSLLQYHSSNASILWCSASNASILWRSAFFTVQLSHPYMTTGKAIDLTGWTFVSKVMSAF